MSEDLDDLRAYDEAKRRLDSGEDELIPEEFANRLLDGESPIRVWRELRGLKVKDLVAEAQISSAYLSQIEKGDREGKLGTMRKLADALGVAIDDLA